jgi:hypothetical protein
MRTLEIVNEISYLRLSEIVFFIRDAQLIFWLRGGDEIQTWHFYRKNIVKNHWVNAEDGVIDWLKPLEHVALQAIEGKCVVSAMFFEGNLIFKRLILHILSRWGECMLLCMFNDEENVRGRLRKSFWFVRFHI